VQEVEDIPKDIENKWNNAVDDVEDSHDWVDMLMMREGMSGDMMMIGAKYQILLLLLKDHWVADMLT